MGELQGALETGAGGVRAVRDLGNANAKTRNPPQSLGVACQLSAFFEWLARDARRHRRR